MQPRDVVQQWVEAFNRADAEELASFYGENATNHQMPEQPVMGRKAIREMFEREFRAAEMVCIPEQILQEGEWAVLEWKDPKGFRGCGFFHIQNGKIIMQRGYWDKLSFLRLNGLPFPRE